MRCFQEEGNIPVTLRLGWWGSNHQHCTCPMPSTYVNRGPLESCVTSWPVWSTTCSQMHGEWLWRRAFRRQAAGDVFGLTRPISVWAVPNWSRSPVRLCWKVRRPRIFTASQPSRQYDYQHSEGRGTPAKRKQIRELEQGSCGSGVRLGAKPFTVFGNQSRMLLHWTFCDTMALLFSIPVPSPGGSQHKRRALT